MHNASWDIGHPLISRVQNAMELNSWPSLCSLFNKAHANFQYAETAAAVLSEEAANDLGKDRMERSFMAVLLGGRYPKQGFNDASKVRLRHFLNEFGTSYVSPKTGKLVAPGKMVA